MTEGYVKFNCDWEQTRIEIQEEIFIQLEVARTKLYKLGLIGMYSDGIGFGNISVRSGENDAFIITGSATGQFMHLNPNHYALVHKFSVIENSISCIGLTRASAESLTHAAVYEVLPGIGAVVHVHCYWLWKKLQNIYPTTFPDIEYGTPQMADAVQTLAIKADSRFEKIIIMGGHRDGILTYGANLNEATEQIIKIYNQYKND